MDSRTERATVVDGDSELDPRIERSRSRVRQAALAELAERGYGGFAIDSVANRAGVARSTIYRHWADKLALVTDALDVLNQQPAPDLDAETPRDRVRTILVHLATAVSDSIVGQCIPAIIEAAEHNPELRDFHYRYNAGRRQALTDAVSAGVDAGDFQVSTNAELAAQSLAGAILYRRLMTGDRFGIEEVDDLINLVLGPSTSG